MEMRKRNLLLFVAVTVLGLLVGCGSRATVAGSGVQSALPAVSGGAEMPYTITVNGTGVASAVPDVADIQLGVESTDRDAAEAISSNTMSMNAVMAAIKELGIEDKDIQTLSYNMWVEQVYDRDGMPTDEMRYHVSNQITVRLRMLDEAGKLLEEALKAGANNVGGITFGVDDTSALESEAREKAIADAEAKAEELAAGFEVRVGKVHQVSEYTSGYDPSPSSMLMRDGLGGGGEVPISGGSFNVSVDVQVIFDIEQ